MTFKDFSSRESVSGYLLQGEAQFIFFCSNFRSGKSSLICADPNDTLLRILATNLTQFQRGRKRENYP